MQRRKKRDAGLKTEVVLEALKGAKTLKQLAAEHGVHPVQVSAWKRIFRAGVNGIFSGSEAGDASAQREIAKLRGKIASLRSEYDWMRKTLAGMEPEARRRLLAPAGAGISLRRQCRLLGITRSTLYYRKKGERSENLELMEKIKAIAALFPDFGVLRITRVLREDGRLVNPKRVRRLMRKLSLLMVFLQSSPIVPVLRSLHFHHALRIL
ncbi:MAG: family transposase [Verrucomicrobiales bacterium]|nr:family transposase [Verrucomicrobiales bacterium]